MSNFHKKTSHHQRHREYYDSGELDVFEAASYFSGYKEPYGSYINSSAYSQKVMRDDQRSSAYYYRPKRMSLDVPAVRDVKMETLKKEKKPSTPKGKLASFLNSLLNQTPLKSKKKKKGMSKNDEEEEEDHITSARRRRRSSISQILGLNKSDSRSIYPSSNLTSGFRTLPPFSMTKAYNNYKDFGSCYSDDEQVFTFPKHGNGMLEEKRELDCLSWFDEKLRILNNGGMSEKCMNIGSDNHNNKKDGICGEKFGSAEENKKGTVIKKFNDEDVDEGAESDSSSDLFELKNYDLGCYSKDNNSHVNNLQRRPPTVNSNGPL